MTRWTYKRSGPDSYVVEFDGKPVQTYRPPMAEQRAREHTERMNRAVTAAEKGERNAGK